MKSQDERGNWSQFLSTFPPERNWDIFWQMSAAQQLFSLRKMSGSQATSGNFRVMAENLSVLIVSQSLLSLLYVIGTQEAFLSGMIHGNLKRLSNYWHLLHLLVLFNWSSQNKLDNIILSRKVIKYSDWINRRSARLIWIILPLLALFSICDLLNVTRLHS